MHFAVVQSIIFCLSGPQCFLELCLRNHTIRTYFEQTTIKWSHCWISKQFWGRSCLPINSFCWVQKCEDVLFLLLLQKGYQNGLKFSNSNKRVCLQSQRRQSHCSIQQIWNIWIRKLSSHYEKKEILWVWACGLQTPANCTLKKRSPFQSSENTFPKGANVWACMSVKVQVKLQCVSVWMKFQFECLISRWSFSLNVSFLGEVSVANVLNFMWSFSLNVSFFGQLSGELSGQLSTECLILRWSFSWNVFSFRWRFSLNVAILGPVSGEVSVWMFHS